MIPFLLAQTDSFTNDKLSKLLDGFGKVSFITIVAIVGLLLLLCISLARRVAKKRRESIEQEQRESEPTAANDLWSESGRRVAMEDEAGDQNADEDDDSDADDDSDLYGKDWEPGDEDDDPDDDERW